MEAPKPDFSGYATKAGLKCSDGRTITPQAFTHQDGVTVPLVWQHGHSSPMNVLGHAVLEARTDGVYCYGYFNETDWGLAAKALVAHKDVNKLSIFANQLVEKAKSVLHGMIKEVSIVLAGANPGALIDNVNIAHDDGTYEELEDEVVIHTGLEFDFVRDFSEEELEHADGQTIQDVIDSMTDTQKNVLHYMVGVALEQGSSMAQSDATEGATSTETPTADDQVGEPTPEGTLTHQEGTTIVTNVFEQNGAKTGERHELSHDDLKGIMATAKRPGQTLKSALEDYCLSHGIEDMDLLFPDAKAVMETPEWNKRRTEWVAGVLNGTRKSPFSRVKSLVADLTLDQARARGYVKGSLKKEEFFGLTKRTTGPKTIYKKQKLDRDDIIDVEDFDVVAWMKGEMRLMLEEEIAISILIGDGREVDDEDKITDPAGAASGDGLRSIANDDDLYAPKFYVNLGDASSSYMELLEQIIRARKFYKGTGTPTLYTTAEVVTEFLLLRDGEDRRYFRTVDDLAAELRVSSIVEVEAMERQTDVVAILVNLADYNIGASKGGEVSLFDDFDIDFNQFKYLIETRISGALIKIRSALVFLQTASTDTLVTPAAPTQDEDEVTIVNTSGATYKVSAFDGVVTYNGSQVAVGTTVTASFPIVMADGTSVTIEATPDSGKYFDNNVQDEWTFTYEA